MRNRRRAIPKRLRQLIPEMISEKELTPKQRIEIAQELIEEVERMLPELKEGAKCIQAAEKIWGAWAQATKAYKYWDTIRAYNNYIGELMTKYPEFKEKISIANDIVFGMHSYGFYEGIICPREPGVKVIKEGINIIKNIIEREEIKQEKQIDSNKKAS